jgi:hypothetical protein
MRRSVVFVAAGLGIATVVAHPRDGRARGELDVDLSLASSAPREMSFRLDAAAADRFDLLSPFRDASVERLGPMRLYLASRWGRRATLPWVELKWNEPDADVAVGGTSDDDEDDDDAWDRLDAGGALDVGAALDVPVPIDLGLSRDRDFLRAFPGVLGHSFVTTGPSLESDGYGALFRFPPQKPVVDWRCRRAPVTIVRYGAESDAVSLVRCDGTMAPDALDKLSILARPPEAPKPEGLLPEEPDPDAWSAAHEWVPGVRVVHPRLVWAVQRIADAFPRRAIYIYSGYRPNAEVHDGTGHKSLHASGRALDIAVFRVPNEEVFKACRELRDVGCGFYPHNKFIHVDVRRAHTGKALWIDASEQGEPAKYVDGWPGVVESGALSWSPAK